MVMYKLLLCWRYLRTRYLAMACIISVMLGVATLIVVNSVMGGFSKKLRERLHGLLSDVVVESTRFEGFADPAEKMQRIRQDPFLQDKVEAMTATLEVFAMLQYRWYGEVMTRPVHVIGIEPESRASVGGFADYLDNPADRAHPSFEFGGGPRPVGTLPPPAARAAAAEPVPAAAAARGEARPRAGARHGAGHARSHRRLRHRRLPQQEGPRQRPGQGHHPPQPGRRDHPDHGQRPAAVTCL
jgi:lipoprotein-releasing system permease protein